MVGAVEHGMKISGWMLGLHGVIAVVLGMALYAVKDRLKDRSKAFLTQKLSKKFPDLARELLVNGKSLGKISEWYSVRKSSQLPEKVRKARHQRLLVGHRKTST